MSIKLNATLHSMRSYHLHMLSYRGLCKKTKTVWDS